MNLLEARVKVLEILLTQKDHSPKITDADVKKHTDGPLTKKHGLYVAAPEKITNKVDNIERYYVPDPISVYVKEAIRITDSLNK